ncbi:solute carrier family 31 (copper transporter), member 1 [Entomortierella parvispora]|uniref:Copper transport protein n=1 Tax=Entomortierella parvispora TaxID=205924 RepID=A0A9P3HJF0_9FUNG|nr:solute carrier family 31 (copper transporter), member 1 [Entomortierella parvispora]
MISSAAGYFGTIVFTVALATLRVAVSNYVFSLQENYKKHTNECAQQGVSLSRFQIYKERLPLAALGAFELLLGWVLMLIVMTFNASLLLSAVGGSFIGFLCFGKQGHTDYDGGKISQIDAEVEPKPSRTPYAFTRSILPRFIAVIFLIILFLWIYQAEGGIGFQEANLFGWHALLMSLFIVVFTQEALLAYSSPLIGFLTKNRTLIKYYHVACHLLGLICAVGGLCAIVYYKKLSPQPVVFPFFTLYSAHSWTGIVFLLLWTLQILAGFHVHIARKKQTAEHKRVFRQFHGFLGKSVYAVGLVTCAMGFQDMQSSDLASSTPPNPVNMTMSMGDMQGYFPNSNLAQYSSACSLLLVFSGMATFLAMRSQR